MKPTQTCIHAKPIVPEEIFKIIGWFNPNESLGHDDITKMVVKNVASEISKPLSTIFSLFLQHWCCT